MAKLVPLNTGQTQSTVVDLLTMDRHSLGTGPGMTHRPMRGLDFRKQQTGAVGSECCVPRWRQMEDDV